ncbi:hypothetical protein [Swaminathania salitolerans]|uniref:Uncharacterized protein n=1 Tax=Swaminathania salitolerans TaxID=182838 RepID=A0A511BSA0_9PROT|nr:hypothetical protein [Swaminathania salitolerans]GBQ12927.1 hypothetical protein AA21291_1348 [Swaminathania salitolerans LMG 21291]GEL03216.1 hypothetical protein SSA02_23790 [Swaminathania salitolerans]
MTNDELIALVAVNGNEATYDARLSGYDITVPVHIQGGDGHFIIKHLVKPIFFSGAMIIDVKLLDADNPDRH